MTELADLVGGLLCIVLVPGCASVRVADFLPAGGCYVKEMGCRSEAGIPYRAFRNDEASILVSEKGIGKVVRLAFPQDEWVSGLEATEFSEFKTAEVFRVEGEKLISGGAVLLSEPFIRGREWRTLPEDSLSRKCAAFRAIEAASERETTVIEFLECGDRQRMPMVRERWIRGAGKVLVESTSDKSARCLFRIRPSACGSTRAEAGRTGQAGAVEQSGNLRPNAQ